MSALQTGAAPGARGRRPDTMPSSVTGDVPVFDRFAGFVSRFASRATFFLLCLVMVLVWLPTIFLFPSVDTWQLVINTVTTIVTFLLVALLQNTQRRADEATQHKLNAIADGLADLMAALGEERPGLRDDLRELRAAVGLEDRESA